MTRRTYSRDIGALGTLVSFPSSGPTGGLEQKEVGKERAFLPGGKGDGNVSVLDFSRLPFPPLCAVSNQGGAADQGCESQWDSGYAHHNGDTEQLSWQGMYSVTKSMKRRQFTKTTDFDEEIHSAKTFEHKNRFQAIAVRNEDSVDEATTNMENGREHFSQKPDDEQ